VIRWQLLLALAPGGLLLLAIWQIVTWHRRRDRSPCGSPIAITAERRQMFIEHERR
jgi:hypothetical protein